MVSRSEVVVEQNDRQRRLAQVKQSSPWRRRRGRRQPSPYYLRHHAEIPSRSHLRCRQRRPLHKAERAAGLQNPGPAYGRASAVRANCCVDVAGLQQARRLAAGQRA